MVPGASKELGDSNKDTKAKHNNSRKPERSRSSTPSTKRRTNKSKDHFEVTVRIDRHGRVNEPKYKTPREDRSKSPAKKKKTGSADKSSELILPTEDKEREKEKKRALKEAGTPHVPQKKPKIVEEHYDDCGEDLSSLRGIDLN